MEQKFKKKGWPNRARTLALLCGPCHRFLLHCDALSRDRFTDKVCRPTLKRKYVEVLKTYLAYHSNLAHQYFKSDQILRIRIQIIPVIGSNSYEAFLVGGRAKLEFFSTVSFLHFICAYVLQLVVRTARLVVTFSFVIKY